jgi:hypothetical protein
MMIVMITMIVWCPQSCINDNDVDMDVNDNIILLPGNKCADNSDDAGRKKSDFLQLKCWPIIRWPGTGTFQATSFDGQDGYGYGCGNNEALIKRWRFKRK